MSRINQDSRRVVRSGTQYPAVVIDDHGTHATVKLSGNGAKLSNLQVIGGPVDIGEQVQVDFTTPEPTVVATSKDWLSIEDILRELGKLPEPYIQDPFQEWDKVLCFCMDDPKEWEFFSPDVNGWYDAQNMIQDDFDALGYSRRWALGIPPGYRGRASIGSQIPSTHECWFPQYVYGMGKENVHIQADELLCTYGVYIENIYFDFWWHEEKTYLFEGISSFGWAWTISSGSVAGNEIRTPANDYLFLPDQTFNGQTFRNCKFRAGNAEASQYGDTDDAYNYAPITLSPAGLDGFYWTRSADDVMIFENCHFITDPDSCYQPRLVINVDIGQYDDGYDTHIYLYDCEVDVGDEPVWSGHPSSKIHSVGTKWIGTNIYGINHHDILQTSDRATLDHVHGSSGSSGGYDPNAVHDDESGEINMVTEKTAPVDADVLLIEDSEASWAKKKVKMENLPTSGSAPDDFTDLSDTPGAYTSEGGKLVSVKGTEDGLEFVNAPTAGSDGNAIHDNVADEIHQVTEKVTPADNDEILIEDSAASWAKKRLKISNLPSSGSGGGDMYKSTYDTNDDGKVNSADAADAVPWSGVSGKPDPLDATAIHDNVSAEISAVTEKTTPHDDDLLLIEDSQASNAKKKLKISNLPSSGSGGGGGPTSITFKPGDYEPTSTIYAQLDTNNQHPVLDFSPTADEEAMWTDFLMEGYDGGGLTVDIYVVTAATSGNTVFQAAIERIETTQDTDTDGFASFQSSGAVAVSGTAGVPVKVTITFTDGSQMDSLAAGELFRLKIRRDADDTSATDSVTANDVSVLAVKVKET